MGAKRKCHTLNYRQEAAHLVTDTGRMPHLGGPPALSQSDWARPPAWDLPWLTPPAARGQQVLELGDVADRVVFAH